MDNLQGLTAGKCRT